MLPNLVTIVLFLQFVGDLSVCVWGGGQDGQHFKMTSIYLKHQIYS